MIDSHLHAHVVASRSAEIAARAESAQMLHRAELAGRRRERAGRGHGLASRARLAVVHSAMRLLAPRAPRVRARRSL
jgi:hypothetical protein